MALDRRRVERVMEAFAAKREVRHSDLPSGIGRRTLELMVIEGYLRT